MARRLTGLEALSSSRRYASLGRRALAPALAQRARLGAPEHGTPARPPELEQGKPERVRSRLAERVGPVPLARLAGRNAMAERIEAALETARREGHHVALILADIDRFRQINDAFGQPIGDDVLRQLAFRLDQAIRPTDLAARLGGGRFAVLLTHLPRPEDAVVVARRLLGCLREPMTCARLFVSMTLGVAASAGHDETAESLLRNGDAALYRAKSTRRGTFFVFDAADREAARSNMLECELDRALRHRVLCLHYQPILDLAGTKPVRVEALLRWPHRERGFIPPSEFVPIAEASGIIHELGRFVVEEACRLHQRLDAERLPNPRICINLSINQLRAMNCAAVLEHTLAREGVAANRFEIEITEDAIIDDHASLAKKLESLRSQGLTLSIDDFGTGNASIARLRQLPVDCVKIDRSLIGDLESSSADAAIVRSIVMLGQSLDFDVVAEGVETPAQLAILRRFGCRLVQGYLLARPMDEAALLRWLASPSCGDKAG